MNEIAEEHIRKTSEGVIAKTIIYANDRIKGSHRVGGHITLPTLKVRRRIEGQERIEVWPRIRDLYLPLFKKTKKS